MRRVLTMVFLFSTAVVLTAAIAAAQDPEQRERECREIGERIEALEREMEQAKRAGRDEDIERMGDEIEHLERRLRELEGDEEPRREGEDREREHREIAERIEVLHREREELLENGNREEAERVGREIEELHAHMEELQRRPEGREEGRDHLAEAVHLMHAAAEHLAAAGRPDMAERLHHAADEVAREARPQEREHGPNPEEVVREVFEQLEQLRNEVRELREAVEESRRER